LGYVILRELNLINESIPVATTVHELQIISNTLIEKHEAQVD